MIHLLANGDIMTTTTAKQVKRPLPEDLLAYQARPLPAEGFVRLPSVLAVFPISAAKWRTGVRNGVFPPAIKLGPKTVVWRVEDIRAMLAKAATGELEIPV